MKKICLAITTICLLQVSIAQNNNSGGNNRNIQFRVSRPIHSILQSSNRHNWAAIGAIMRSYQTGNNVSEEGFAASLVPPFPNMYNNNSNIALEEIEMFADQNNFTKIIFRESQFNVRTIMQLMQRYDSPMAMFFNSEIDRANCKGIVIVGLDGDGTDDGTIIYYYDPSINAESNNNFTYIKNVLLVRTGIPKAFIVAQNNRGGNNGNSNEGARNSNNSNNNNSGWGNDNGGGKNTSNSSSNSNGWGNNNNNSKNTNSSNNSNSGWGNNNSSGGSNSSNSNNNSGWGNDNNNSKNTNSSNNSSSGWGNNNSSGGSNSSNSNNNSGWGNDNNNSKNTNSSNNSNSGWGNNSGNSGSNTSNSNTNGWGNNSNSGSNTSNSNNNNGWGNNNSNNGNGKNSNNSNGATTNKSTNGFQNNNTSSGYNLPRQCPQIAQSMSNRCWIACAAMLKGYRDNSNYSESDIAQILGEPYRSLYNNNQTLQASQKEEYVRRMGWRIRNTSDVITPRFLLNLMQSVNAPIIVTIGVPIDQGVGFHAIVMTGIGGDGTSEGTTVTYIDPTDGQVHQSIYSDFEINILLGRNEDERNNSARARFIYY